ncbi:hypothetical protein QVD17_03785 [Tagetes erecta]|uniref:Phytocyanin domain-containing protein n=1 Tax=Tagetes erecta TaxID=13708 RepID=A0AAD8L8Y3_TARER|nr:hypothetical protein QVD17_03785 [Tagetes erecta]
MKLITSIHLLVILAGFIGSCYGYTFYAGGKDGWVLDPHENYNHWAERNRFQVNDTIVFKYKKGLDSVLVVNEEAYNTCNKTNHLETLNDDQPVFKFKRSGPFFFISGHDGNCEKGQKLIIVVMAITHHTHGVKFTTATPAPAPALEVQAPSVTIQTTGGMRIYAPAPAPAATSSVTSVGYGSFVGLISGLGLILVF